MAVVLLPRHKSTHLPLLLHTYCRLSKHRALGGLQWRNIYTKCYTHQSTNSKLQCRDTQTHNILYMITLCTSSALTCSVWHVKLRTGYGWGSLDPHIVFTICWCIYLYLRRKVHSYSVQQIKITFSQQKRKQPSLPSRNNNLCFY
jgi:hypothetical protein